MNGRRDLFLATLRAVRPVVASPKVGARWEEPSALLEFSIRGLAGHLVRATLTVDTYLANAAPENHGTISAVEYYAGLDPDLSSPTHAAIRRRGEELAAGGHESLVVQLDGLTSDLETRLQGEPGTRCVTVAGNAVLRLDEYLITRIIELAVHADDLAVSVGMAPPPLPPAAFDLVIDTLVAIARYRHGDLAVLRALSRRERDLVQALRVF